MELLDIFNVEIGVLCVILFVYAFLLFCYLNAERLNNGYLGFRMATGLKLLLGALFCTAAYLSYYMLCTYSNASQNYRAMSALSVAALFFALGGDFFLQFIRLDEFKYKIGIAFFLVCQALLIIREIGIYGINWASFLITAMVLLFFAWLMAAQRWQLGGAKYILTVYTVCVAFMGCNGFVSFLLYPSINSGLFGIGALLFLISDIILGIWNYHNRRDLYADLNRITYFAGVMMIALSICPIK